MNQRLAKIVLGLLMVQMIFLAACNSSTTVAKEEKPPLIDMKDFFRNAEKTGFQVSPSGEYISYRADYKGRMNIFVRKVNDTNAVRITSDTSRSIMRYFWKGDHILYLQDIGGDENFQLFSVKPDGTDLKALTPFAGYRTDILDDLSFIDGKEKEVIILLNKRTKEYFDPYLMNIETGQMTMLYDNKENFDNWSTDNTGTIRLASKTDGVNVTLKYRNTDKDTFRTIISTTFKESFIPMAFDGNNQHIYALSNIGRDKSVLVEYDPVANKEVKELFADKDYDLSGIQYDRKKKALLEVNWVAEKSEDHYFDAEWEAINKTLDEKFKGYETNLYSWDNNYQKGVVWVGNDRLPGKFYLYDFKTKETTELANARPWLKEDQLAEMKPIVYQSRDGLTIHGYLTLPKGVDPKNLPVVVNPHGGPWARDEWGYNSEIQFLANRGYAVLQMNFRGSTGYGRKFWESSFKQWGRKMQDDITDGVEWLKKEGIADPKRIAIYGGSYGGYATLAGVTFTPDLYAAAVDYVGVANMFTFMNTIPPYWKPYLEMFHEMAGDPKKDSALLAEVSPALHADKIKTPLFIAQGANDPRVNKNESDQMVEALKKRGIQVEYMVKNDEGHGFLNENNRFDFYGAMEKFLDKHLKPKQEMK